MCVCEHIRVHSSKWSEGILLSPLICLHFQDNYVDYTNMYKMSMNNSILIYQLSNKCYNQAFHVHI